MSSPKVSFNFAKANNPLVIISDLPDEEFLKYIKEELRKSKLVKTKYYKIIGNFGDEKQSLKAEWKVSEKSKLHENPILSTIDSKVIE